MFIGWCSRDSGQRQRQEERAEVPETLIGPSQVGIVPSFQWEDGIRLQAVYQTISTILLFFSLSSKVQGLWLNLVYGRARLCPTFTTLLYPMPVGRCNGAERAAV